MPPGPVYDDALGLLQRMTASAAGAIDENQRQVKLAGQASAANWQAAQFSLGLEDTLQRAQDLKVGPEGRQRWATPDEQEGFFRQQAQGLVDKLSDIPGADPEVSTQLRNSLVNETASAVLRLRQVQRKRQLEQIEDETNRTLEAAYQTGSLPLVTEALNDQVHYGVITDAKRKEILEGFEAEVELNQSLAQLHRDPETVVQRMGTLLDRGDLTEKQRNRGLNLLARAQASTQAMKNEILLRQAEARRALVGKLADALDENNPKMGEAIEANDLLTDEEKKQWTSRMVARRTTTETDYSAYAKLQGEMLDAVSGQGDRSLEDFRNELLKARYDDQKVSQADYDNVRSWSDLDPVQAASVQGARRTAAGLLAAWLPEWLTGGARKKLATITDHLVRVARSDRGASMSPKDFDLLARQMFSQATSPPVDVMQRAYEEATGISPRPIVHTMFSGQEQLPDIERQPQTVQEFTESVRALNDRDPVKARAYYERWKDEF
ncbi:MAG: hypothetical protein WC907_00910 [Acholeplasmataceae bacterium]|jgi:hypothetical protein